MRRSPHGERGLKFRHTLKYIRTPCRSPHGERGLKSALTVAIVLRSFSRSPHGERGLKYH